MEWILKALQDPAHLGIILIFIIVAIFFYKVPWPKISKRINGKLNKSEFEEWQKQKKELIQLKEGTLMTKEEHSLSCERITTKTMARMDELFSHHREWVQGGLNLIQATITNDVLKALADLKNQAIDDLKELRKEIRSKDS